MSQSLVMDFGWVVGILQQFDYHKCDIRSGNCHGVNSFADTLAVVE
jgi:hypothetical protein